MPQPLQQAGLNAMNRRPSSKTPNHAGGHGGVRGVGGENTDPSSSSKTSAATSKKNAPKSRHAPGSRANPISLDDDDDDPQDQNHALSRRGTAHCSNKPTLTAPATQQASPPYDPMMYYQRWYSTSGRDASTGIGSGAGSHSAAPRIQNDAAASLSTQEREAERIRQLELPRQQLWDEIERRDHQRRLLAREQAARDMARRRQSHAGGLAVAGPSSNVQPSHHHQFLKGERSTSQEVRDQERYGRETALRKARDEHRRRHEEDVAARALRRSKSLSNVQPTDRAIKSEDARAHEEREGTELRESERRAIEMVKEARENRERKRQREIEAATALRRYQSEPTAQPRHQLIKTEDARARQCRVEMQRRIDEQVARREREERDREGHALLLEGADRTKERYKREQLQARMKYEAAERQRRVDEEVARREREKREKKRRARLAAAEDDSQARALQPPNSSNMQLQHHAVKTERAKIPVIDLREPSPPDDIEDLLRMPAIDIPEHLRPATPKEMLCELLPHQKVALKWLKEQEKDQAKRGGLLADTMGLGKTISALALILANKAPVGTPKTTLIVAPLALLRQWDREIQEKVKPAHMLSTFIYHGRSKRTRQARKLSEFNVVLTSYETVTSDFHNVGKDNSKALLYQQRFFRIILDEAHRIKNRNTRGSVAVAELQAQYRLCMTGTPFMNSAIEFYSLLRFLRIKPYNNLDRFRAEIERPIRKWDKDPEEHKEAMQKLQAVFRSITLRRTKTSRLDGKPIITLPEKTIAEYEVVLDEEQRAFYTALEHQQRITVNKYLKRGRSNKIYTYILLLLLRLRQVCCHPHLIKNHGIPDEAALNGKEMVSLALRLDKKIVEHLSQKTEFKCPLCDNMAETPIIIYPCGHDICADCFSMMMQVSQRGRLQADQDRMLVLDPFEDTEACCPHEDCGIEVDPKKVLCHVFFQVAYGLGDASEELREELEEEEDDSDNGQESGDDQEPTKSDDEFVVDDEEVEYEEQNSGDEGEVEGEEEDSQVEDESEQEHEGGSKRRRRSTLHKDVLESEDESDIDDASEPEKAEKRTSKTMEKRPTKTKEEPEEEEGNGWSYVSRRQSEGWAVQDDSSDSDESFLSLGAIIRRTAPDAPERDADASKKTSKRKRTPKDETPAKPEKRVKTEGKKHVIRQAKSSCKKEEEEDVKPQRKKEEKKKKKKKKKAPELTLSELRKKSLQTKAARARYFERLRQDFVSSAKIDATLDILRDIRDNKPGEKTLVFSLWTSFLDLLEIPLRDENFRFLRYDGATPPAERDDNVREFQEDNGEVQILLVSLQAGNAGLNLTAASQVIILEPFWNPFVEDQAIDRAHRIGQRRPVEVYRLLVPDSVEDRILQLQERKRALVEAALSEKGAIGAGRLPMGELRALFGFGR